ncbi:type II toxin-antitoxin system HicA family toxin [Phascolarctobacterium succinatutens]|uniref:type II toxin-antitoxin system HicA family toxin n=1 Tax=Phascolarctobacterium succinatutens TaxID=626940 RepID=UPI003F81B3B6
MSQWEKLLYKLKKLSPDMRFEKLQKILESYGYEMQSPRSGSSHFSFRKKGKAVITIPKHKPVKKVYIKLVKNIVESEEEK